MAIQRERLIRQFTQLVRIDSESFHERQMADYLTGVFAQMGIVLTEDDSANRPSVAERTVSGYLSKEPRSSIFTS